MLNEKEKVLRDGVYYVTEKGRVVAPDYFTGNDAERRAVIGVLIKQGERNLVVALDDSPTDEETELTTQSDPDDCKGNYIQEYIDAADDWNGKANTDHLKAVGLSPNIHLEKGWYIPSMGEMLFIFTHKKAVNKALEKIKAQPISTDLYWTSTEYNAAVAWRLYLTSGHMSTGIKDTSTPQVRPVSAFWEDEYVLV